jgi:hypothetical protein
MCSPDQNRCKLRLDDRRAEILDTQYFHVVFTLPAEIAVIALQNRAVVYGTLFRTVAQTLRTIATETANRSVWHRSTS